jgi:hypothetical protein
MGFGQFAARLSGEQQKSRPEHLAAEAADVTDEHVHAGNVAVKLVVEESFDLRELRGDAIVQACQSAIHIGGGL